MELLIAGTILAAIFVAIKINVSIRDLAQKTKDDPEHFQVINGQVMEKIFMSGVGEGWDTAMPRNVITSTALTVGAVITLWFMRLILPKEMTLAEDPNAFLIIVAGFSIWILFTVLLAGLMVPIGAIMNRLACRLACGSLKRDPQGE